MIWDQSVSRGREDVRESSNCHIRDAITPAPVDTHHGMRDSVSFIHSHVGIIVSCMRGLGVSEDDVVGRMACRTVDTSQSSPTTATVVSILDKRRADIGKTLYNYSPGHTG